MDKLKFKSGKHKNIKKTSAFQQFQYQVEQKYRGPLRATEAKLVLTRQPVKNDNVYRQMCQNDKLLKLQLSKMHMEEKILSESVQYSQNLIRKMRKEGNLDMAKYEVLAETHTEVLREKYEFRKLSAELQREEVRVKEGYLTDEEEHVKERVEESTEATCADNRIKKPAKRSDSVNERIAVPKGEDASVYDRNEESTEKAGYSYSRLEESTEEQAVDDQIKELPATSRPQNQDHMARFPKIVCKVKNAISKEICSFFRKTKLVNGKKVEYIQLTDDEDEENF